MRFFAYFMAKTSPLFYRLSFPVIQFVGKEGSFFFFGFLVIAGCLMMFKPNTYTSRLFKFGLLLLLFISSILNFPLLKVWAMKWSLTQSMKTILLSHGWRLWYAWLRWGVQLFGAEIAAIQYFFYLALAVCLFAIGMYYKIRVPVPSIKLNGMARAYEAVKQKQESSSKKQEYREQKETIVKQPKLEFWEKEVSTGFLNSLKEKISQVTNTTIEEIPESGNGIQSTWNVRQEVWDNNTLKNLLKDKISKRLQTKEDEKSMTLMHVNFPDDKPTFPLTLLDIDTHKEPGISEEWLLHKAESVKAKLKEFDIDVEIEGCNIGPTVLQFKIKPESGVKIAKIEGLKKDMSLAIKAKSVRILAPIPDTDCVGIEIPNPKPQMVRLREILWSMQFTQLMSKNLTNLTLGTGIDGSTVVKSLEEMPHVLIAGATGSGKSVGVNSFILSLIYQNSPAELKFLMVDPKQVELGIYEGIPYLLAPIITEADKAVKVLKWAVDHMNERYLKLKNLKVRNIIEYNEKVGEHEKMYRMVIIIDELADLMMSGSKKDTELYITRIAQMARAVGMHLMLATQRPSVNVITGLIKANIPTRIAFWVVQNIDSRCILDQGWAEDLVGKWDMLYLDPKTKYPIRVQGCFVSTAETEAVIEEIRMKYMKEQGLNEGDTYHPEIMRILESKGETTAGGIDVTDDDEALIEQAIDVILQTNKASATMLQRKLGIGFPRAAKIIDILEDRGMVGPQEGAKPREIMM
jgi:DNA segregation ATPase FtsK/SpoIIIE, S-DNA-T family